jgi:hypothetical protein
MAVAKHCAATAIAAGIPAPDSAVISTMSTTPRPAGYGKSESSVSCSKSRLLKLM